jgi:hypothetical protein
MDIRILDLDGALTAQKALLQRRYVLCPARDWGPHFRLACSFGRFRRFERTLAERLGGAADRAPCLTLYGSGDFHHVSLALVRRLTRPFNLLVLDNHPDWMRGLPFLHCGTWLYHAARLPLLRHVFHVGGDVDFDNAFRWLAPWQMLREGHITVFPAVRRFQGVLWAGVDHEPLRPDADTPLTPERLHDLLDPYRKELVRWPLYVSLDKDVMTPDDAVVNWDSGHLHLSEVSIVLEGFENAARGNLAGMDIVGDWSPVRLQGWFRRLFHWTEHPALAVNPADARQRNEQVNLALLADRASWLPSAGAELPVAGVA